MRQVSIRELRNHGGDIVDLASGGELVTITRSGRPVAELRALPPAQLSAAQVLARWRELPRVDVASLRADIDSTLDATL